MQYEDINTWLREKKVRCITDKTFPLQQIHEAYEYQHSGCAVGKVIVVVKE